MKRIVFALFLVAFYVNVNAQQRCLNIVSTNGTDASFLTSMIDEIRIVPSETIGKYVQEIHSNGKVYTLELSENVETQFGMVDTSEVCVFKEYIGDWEEMRIKADGSLFMQKADPNNPNWKDIVLLLPNDTLGTYLYSIVLDDNDMPKLITINDCLIKVDRYDGESIDLTIAYNDSITQTLDSLEWKYDPAPVTRAANENNWQRNVSGVIELAAGAASVVAGAVTIAGSVLSEAGTLGLSTPISVPGIAVGSLAIAGGCSTFQTGFEKLFAPGETRSNVLEGIGEQMVSNALQDERYLSVIPNEYFAYLREPRYTPHDAIFWAGLFAGIFDNLYGRTVTWDDIVDFYKGRVVTGISTDITSSSATLRGYVYPEITHSPLDGRKFENEYGIILNPGQRNSVVTKKVVNGDGGAVEFSFDKLDPHTTYTYTAYYFDKTNTIFQQGDTRTFSTLSVLPRITAFRQMGSEYSEGKFYNDGRYYDYKFDVATTIEIESLEGIADWGYVYRDPYGNEKRISLMQFGTSYTDTRYAYYRNEAKSTACLYGYVKYRGDDEYYYDEPHDYPLEYKGSPLCPDGLHAHAVDLGLPSGTKWACCNVGASSPEEYGGYYAWGEVAEKGYYSWENYAYYNDNTGGCQYIGSEISGTQYDVAHVQWGGSWRMPTLAQCKELIECCSSSWTSVNGVWGTKVVGPNGNSIFLPAAGYRRYDGLLSAGSFGYYWSGKFGGVGGGFSYQLDVYSGGLSWGSCYGSCAYGHSVRPVCQ